MDLLKVTLLLSVSRLAFAELVARQDQKQLGKSPTQTSITDAPLVTGLTGDKHDPDNEDFWKGFANLPNPPALWGKKRAKNDPIVVTLYNKDGSDPETVEFNIPETMTVPKSVSSPDPKDNKPITTQTTTAAPKPTQTQPPTKLTCYDYKKTPNAYIHWQDMEDHAKKFCSLKEVVQKGAIEWNQVYDENTYGGAKLYIKTNGDIFSEECKNGYKKIWDECKKQVPNNPMGFNYGGEYEENGRKYAIAPHGSRARNRVTENGGPMTKPRGNCDSFYQFVRDEFWIYGAGFRNKDFGMELFNQMKNCIGSSPTDWRFDYYDSPRNDGIEWVAFGHTPVFQKNCFSPVIKGSGGPDIPCNGSG
jgi:hypothetical protein